MHAPETAAILKGGARIMTISNEHPEALTRLVPDPAMKDIVRGAVATCRHAKTMTVTSPAGTDLDVGMEGAATVGVWGWTDRAGTLAHWPGGIVVSFPRANSVNGRLVFQPGDMNLTFKKYFESEVAFTLKDDFVTEIAGSGTDARLMRAYLEGFGDRNAYATSHVGWGLAEGARYEALTLYDRTDTNCTELRGRGRQFPLFDRRQRIRQPVYQGSFRPADDGMHHRARRLARRRGRQADPVVLKRGTRWPKPRTSPTRKPDPEIRR